MTQAILQSWADAQWPEVKCTTPLTDHAGVVDQGAFDAIEVDKVFDAVNHASTLVGQAVLYRSLCQPLAEIERLQAKQEAIKELADNPELKAEVERVVSEAAEHEQNLYTLLYGEFVGAMGGTATEEHQIEGYGYLQYKRAVRFMLELVGNVQAISTPKSAYLQELCSKFSDFAETREYSLMAGPVYVSEKGIQSKEERQGSFIPAVIFKPRLIKPLLIALIFACLWAIAHFFPTDIFKVSVEAIPTAVIFLIPMLLVYIPIVGGYDRDNVIIPLRNEFKKSAAVAEIFDALGQFDELLSFFKFSEAFGSTTVLPHWVSASKQQLNLQGVKNPVLGKANPEFVQNDLVMEEDRLVLITGPNSGGKTVFCKTVTQVQLLAQIGCFIPAEAATLSVADKVFYQTPEISHMADGEGRFGTELKRTKDIFLASSANSLIVLDELSEGTTFEEKMESSINVLDGFYRKGCNTILITHNHQLVDHFMRQRVAVAKQVEFAEDHPTFRLISGISRVSHADRVAKKIGFSKQDIDNYLAKE